MAPTRAVRPLLSHIGHTREKQLRSNHSCLCRHRWLTLCLLVGLTASVQCAGENKGPSGSTSPGNRDAGQSGSGGASGTGPTQIGNGGAGGGAGDAGNAGDAGDAVECTKDDECGSGQACVSGRCAAKPCTPPATHFAVKAEGATVVNLAGAFNGWSPTATPMLRSDPAGPWKVDLDLAPGTYPYKFVLSDGMIDAGGPKWIPDPDNPATIDDGFGGVNSVITVACDGVVAFDAGPPAPRDAAPSSDTPGDRGADASAADVSGELGEAHATDASDAPGGS